MPRNSDEVEIMNNYDDIEDEVILNKTKKTQERIEILEQFMQKFIDMMVQNQKIVEGLVRSNDALREDIAVMIGKMEHLYDKFDEFVTLVKEAAKEDTEENVAKEVIKTTIEPLKDTMEKMVETLKESNDSMSDILISIDKRLKRLANPSSQTVDVGNIRDKMMEILNKNNASVGGER